ncbi:MAG: hypothetical protein WCG82_02010 [Bacteroidota bacterium]
MTTQVKDKLFYNGKEYWIKTDPLDSLFELMGDEKPVFVAKYSDWERGYAGTWEIENDRLYLIDFKGHTTNFKEVSLDFLFPTSKKVFAGWFTGEIKIPQGKELWGAIISIREKDWCLEFKNGVLVNSRIEVNKNFSLNPRWIDLPET